MFLICALALPAAAQDDEVAPEKPAKPPVPLIFTPPDLDGRIVIGIFDRNGKLRRSLAFDENSPELKIDTNGYIAEWDGRDDAGQPCPGGRYSARGYVVGEDVAVEGEAYHFNDWMAEDGIPATGVRLRGWRDGIGVELATRGSPVFGRISDQGDFIATSPPLVPDPLAEWRRGSETTPGRDGTVWAISRLSGSRTVVQQLDRDARVVREFRPTDLVPKEILSSPTEDAVLLLETGANLRRVRMLRRTAAGAPGDDGRLVADWEIVFERTLQACGVFGLRDGKLVADAGSASQSDSIEFPLVENALSAMRQKLRLKAAATGHGSALLSPEGLELVGISVTGGWSRFVFDGDGKNATLYQGNGLVVEEFSVRNLDRIARFDAGTFLLAAPSKD